MLADTGIRVSELLPLRKTDIDFDKRLVYITKSLVDGDRGAPKTKHSSRIVSFSPTLSARLATRVAVSRTRTSCSDEQTDVRSIGHGCTTSCGTLPTALASRGLLAAYAPAHVRDHPLQARCPEEQIRTALGHDSWEFTHRVYVHDDTIPKHRCVRDRRLVRSAA